jgi:hypothetical protein
MVDKNAKNPIVTVVGCEISAGTQALPLTDNFS